ncbi:hypothetical protein ABPG77_009716 [Micractinium sp. CCAP 211/92]
MPRSYGRADPSWRSLARQYWPQYAVTALIFALMELVDPLQPVPRFIYHESDAEYWRYSRPMVHDSRLPLWLVPCVSLLLPAAVILGAHLAGRASRREAHHACLMLFFSVALTGLVCNLLKSQVGRPRPDFMSRCWPSGGKPAWTPAGLPQCEEGVSRQVLKTGMRSFPSVHAAWTAAGLGFLSLWLAGSLGCFAGLGAAPAQLALVLAPLALAAWVGVTRLQENRHHPEDVLGAQLLGLLLAALGYRQIFASPFAVNAGRLNEELAAGSDAEQEVCEEPEAGDPSEPLVP